MEVFVAIKFLKDSNLFLLPLVELWETSNIFGGFCWARNKAYYFVIYWIVFHIFYTDPEPGRINALIFVLAHKYRFFSPVFAIEINSIALEGSLLNLPEEFTVWENLTRETLEAEVVRTHGLDPPCPCTHLHCPPP